MIITESTRYKKMLKDTLAASPDLSVLNGKSVMITGASGMIGSMLTDAFMLHNLNGGSCKVIAVVRNKSSALSRFNAYLNSEYFEIMVHDVNEPFDDMTEYFDYIIHAASNAHPIVYAQEPINTITANVYGTKHLLDLASKKQNCRFVMLSSVEVYGEGRGDTESFCEDYCGYINCNTLRAGYPESKRVAEALCQAYIKEKSVDAVILRIPRSYGPTMKFTDSKASAQFILKCLNNEDIVLKSAGEQKYSYACSADDVSGILTVMLKGKCSEAYNLADSSSDVKLKELAAIIAGINGKEVVFGEQSSTEKQGASGAMNGIMNSDKLKGLGWRPIYDIKTGVEETVAILKEIKDN